MGFPAMFYGDTPREKVDPLKDQEVCFICLLLSKSDPGALHSAP